METKKSSISLDPAGDDFILRVTAETGHETKITLSAENVLSLAQHAPSFRQSIMARDYPEGAVFATPVSHLNPMWDALGENILMELGFEPVGNAIYEVEPQKAREFAGKLYQLLADTPASQLTRQ